MKIRRSERGQALAEYMPLIPPVLLLSILILIPLAEHTGDIYCRMVNALEPEKCQVITTEDDLEPTDEPDNCVVLALDPSCNRGIGNYAEGCDPGNSSGKGKGDGRRAGEDREEALGPQGDGGAQCDQHDDCSSLPGVNTGSFWGSGNIETVVIQSGKWYSKYYSPGNNDGCFNVTFEDNFIHWEKIGKGKDCKDITSVQAWKTAVCE